MKISNRERSFADAAIFLSQDENTLSGRQREIKTRERTHGIKRWYTTITVAAIILTFTTVIIAVTISVPQSAIYFPVITIGLALALQKYIACFFAYFIIIFSRTFDLGDRIRIGNIKGDVRRVGPLHTTLEEVGEDEKLGGELTGRITYVPNLVVMDQPVVNYSKDYSVQFQTINSDYLFDEVRIPVSPDTDVQAACDLLDSILKSQDEAYVLEARRVFRNGYPRFLDEAVAGPRVLVYVEPKNIWIKGKFVAPVRGRNELRSRILLQFFSEMKTKPCIKLA